MRHFIFRSSFVDVTFKHNRKKLHKQFQSRWSQCSIHRTMVSFRIIFNVFWFFASNISTQALFSTQKMSYANKIRYDRYCSHTDISNEAVDKINFSIQRRNKQKNHSPTKVQVCSISFVNAHIVCLHVIIASSFRNICLKVLTVNKQ